MEHYGQPTPPDYDLSLLDFPVAIFSGSLDKVCSPADAKWVSNRLQNTTVFNGEYRLGHETFMIAKDMSYFDVDLINVINRYNGNHYSSRGSTT